MNATKQRRSRKDAEGARQKDHNHRMIQQMSSIKFPRNFREHNGLIEIKSIYLLGSMNVISESHGNLPI